MSALERHKRDSDTISEPDWQTEALLGSSISPAGAYKAAPPTGLPNDCGRRSGAGSHDQAGIHLSICGVIRAPWHRHRGSHACCSGDCVNHRFPFSVCYWGAPVPTKLPHVHQVPVLGAREGRKTHRASGSLRGGKSDYDAHRPRRIGLRRCYPRNGRERGSTRCQIQKFSSVGKFHHQPLRVTPQI
jgi:hypothetical protein